MFGFLKNVCVYEEGFCLLFVGCAYDAVWSGTAENWQCLVYSGLFDRGRRLGGVEVCFFVCYFRWLDTMMMMEMMEDNDDEYNWFIST